jgi:hypothetical protein
MHLCMKRQLPLTTSSCFAHAEQDYYREPDFGFFESGVRCPQHAFRNGGTSPAPRVAEGQSELFGFVNLDQNLGHSSVFISCSLSSLYSLSPASMDNSVSSSDGSSFDATSTGPTTPEWSPYLLPLTASPSFDSRVSGTRVTFGAHNLGPAAIPEQPIRSVCMIGAGYVGEISY